jgi:HK97 family phage major capsid protein
MRKLALESLSALVPAGIVIAMADQSTLETLRAQQDELLSESEDLITKADEEGRDLSEEELEKIDANKAKIENLAKQITARETIQRPTAGRRSTPELQNHSQPGRPTVPATVRDNARHGFKSFGEFAQCVHAHYGRHDAGATGKLQNVATTYGAESTGADGGFAVPPEFRRAIWEKVNSQDNLLTRCAQMEVAGNSITLPKDETTPWQTSGGVLAYWEGEGDATTASKPQLKLDTLRLNKLMALVPISEELLSDAPAIESWLRMKAPAKMVSKINTAIIRGNGVGQPLGILEAGSLVSVAKEASQDAASVWFANVVKMYARLYAPCRPNAVWLINQDVEPELLQMAFDPEATSKVPVYLPPNGVSQSPFGTLLGRPVVPVEACSTAGTQGDIIVADLTQYLALVKAGQGVQTDVSMHLYFDQALQAFRFIFRMSGQPLWGSTISPENGSNTRSWAVTLDARA